MDFEVMRVVERLGNECCPFADYFPDRLDEYKRKYIHDGKVPIDEFNVSGCDASDSEFPKPYDGETLVSYLMRHLRTFNDPEEQYHLLSWIERLDNDLRAFRDAYKKYRKLSRGYRRPFQKNSPIGKHFLTLENDILTRRYEEFRDLFKFRELWCDTSEVDVTYFG